MALFLQGCERQHCFLVATFPLQLLGSADGICWELCTKCEVKGQHCGGPATEAVLGQEDLFVWNICFEQCW